MHCNEVSSAIIYLINLLAHWGSLGSLRSLSSDQTRISFVSRWSTSSRVAGGAWRPSLSVLSSGTRWSRGSNCPLHTHIHIHRPGPQYTCALLIIMIHLHGFFFFFGRTYRSSSVSWYSYRTILSSWTLQ